MNSRVTYGHRVHAHNTGISLMEYLFSLDVDEVCAYQLVTKRNAAHVKLDQSNETTPWGRSRLRRSLTFSLLGQQTHKGIFPVMTVKIINVV